MKTQKILKILSFVFAIATIIAAIYAVFTRTSAGPSVVLMVTTIILQSIARSHGTK